MTLSDGHLDDDILSARIDDRLTPAEAELLRAHLETCQACRQRLADLQSVVDLLVELPTLDPPRRLFGLRLVPDPPNVVRLRRLYTLARAGAASLAALFVVASVGTLYVGSEPSPRPTALQSIPATAPAAQPALAPAAAPAADSAASGARAAAAPRANSAASSAGNAESDQSQAPTAVRPLPTATAAPPTAQPVAPPAPGYTVASNPPQSTAFLRFVAIVTGLFTALGVLTAVVLRRRLQHAAWLSTSTTE